jgi:hypothetical protein
MTETPYPVRKGMDALSDVLRVAKDSGVFLHADFFAPWCMSARVAPEHCASIPPASHHLIVYHYVVEGDCIRDQVRREGPVIGARAVRRRAMTYI